MKKRIMRTKKYYDEFNNSKNKQEFISILLKKYPGIKKETAERRYYDIKKKFNVIIKKEKYRLKDKIKPHDLKILMIKDMVRYGIKVDREYLQRHGLNLLEINWLIDEGIINIE
jgi:hypothetical protein